MENNENLEFIKGLYLGDRQENFKTLITNVLKSASIKDRYIELLTSEENLEEYGSAFTSELVDPINNYQVDEQLGDLSGNKFIVWYIYERFPQLKCAEGVKVAARLRINYGSKNTFWQIAESLGFWDFISAPNDLRQRKRKSLLEDVFEAFIGTTERILDNQICHGIGYATIYKILQSIFDKMDISLKFENLYDAKTRLKELFDMRNSTLGILSYEETKEDLITKSIAYRTVGEKKIMIGTGHAALKSDAQQNAAANALQTLKKEKFVKPVPVIYEQFDKNLPKPKTTLEDVIKICPDKEKINEIAQIQGKTKYQNKYFSSPLGFFSKNHDYEGIKITLSMGADPNVEDSDGLTCTDLILIGKKNVSFVYKVLTRFSRVQEKLVVHRNVFETYYSKYPKEKFSKFILNVVE